MTGLPSNFSRTFTREGTEYGCNHCPGNRPFRTYSIKAMYFHLGAVHNLSMVKRATHLLKEYNAIRNWGIENGMIEEEQRNLI